MVALFLRLRLAQFSHSLRRRPTELLGLAILLALGLVLTGYAIESFADISELALGEAATRGILSGALITLGFLLLPLLTVPDDIADPRVFGPLGLRAGIVARGLAASALISVPSVLLIVTVLAYVLAWSAHPGVALVAVLSGVLIIATTVLGARLTRSLAVIVFSARRLREMAGLLGVFALLSGLPFALSLALGMRESSLAERVAEAASAVGASPLGLAWAAPADAAAGDIDGALGKLTLALLFLAVLWLLWYALVARMLRTRGGVDPSLEVAGRGLGWFDVMPRTAAGAIAARSLSYWVRDGRYKLALAVIPVISLAVIVPFLVIGVWWQNLALVPLPVACLFIGWLLHNDLAHDSSALWMHIAANVPGWADRLGRAIPVLALGIVVIALLAPISVLLYGDWTVFPSMLGVCISAVFSGVGISSYLSARMPYAAVRPGASPFAQPQSSGSAAGQAVSFFLIVLACLPSLLLAGMELAEGGDWGLYSLLAGIGVGLLVLVLGIAAGARVFSRQAPELLAFTLRN
ncbi:ABC transporter permease [Salinibacterium sp. SYSU T00001]|uniref:ABC transporter permease n=1 Tax=Homoserinimonas sedimenticola TaxID=2986805 RepID=UPI0022360B63|nr:ABC transporter permease [Salinibacterium sedimenticola]MCW4386564.1 ABC transporter permease [Salinibacterium sedimenticola]